MKNILEDLYHRIIKNPVSTLIGICLFVGLAMVYKGTLAIDQLETLAMAIAAVVAILYKSANNNNNTPSTS